jgi:hypothetical protein
LYGTGVLEKIGRQIGDGTTIKALFQEPLLSIGDLCICGQLFLRYSNLKIQRLITSKKDFSAGASFSMVSFWCFRAGISNDFFTVVFIRIDFKLSII